MSNPFHKEEDLQAISEVNVVPLADVSLVLLIILLLLSPMMAQSSLHVRTAAKAKTTLEEAPAVPYFPEKPAELILLVDLGPGGIAVGDNLFSSVKELSAYLRGELLKREDRKVFLAPHGEAMHGQVVELLEAIKGAGADSVALVQTVADPGAP